jgi:ribosomal protein S18 acetylase RimI-like enzyme
MDTATKESIHIRNAALTDLEAVISLDHLGSKEEKPGYWRGIFDHYLHGNNNDRHFLVAEHRGSVVGFIVGEVRAWEFGSPPCGWVFALAVSPTVREGGIGLKMFTEISRRMKEKGVTTIRTMVDRDNRLLLSFFRSIGLTTGRYLEMERSLY